MIDPKSMYISMIIGFQKYKI